MRLPGCPGTLPTGLSGLGSGGGGGTVGCCAVGNGGGGGVVGTVVKPVAPPGVVGTVCTIESDNADADDGGGTLD